MQQAAKVKWKMLSVDFLDFVPRQIDGLSVWRERDSQNADPHIMFKTVLYVFPA